MNIFSWLGWPSCAKKGCENPGVIEVLAEGDAGPLKAHLCVTCISETGPCMKAMLNEISKDELALKAEIRGLLERRP